MSSFSKWYRPHCSPDVVPDRLHKTLFHHPQPIIRGRDGAPVTARLVVPPRTEAISGALGATAVHMKMVLVQEDEEQQKEESKRQKEGVMQSIEKVDEDGNVVHRMGGRNNYLDEHGNIMSRDALVHPFYGQRVDLQQETFHPKRYMPTRNAKIEANTKFGAFTTVRVSDPATDNKDKVKHQDEDIAMDEEITIEENKDSYTDIAAAIDAKTKWIPIPLDKQVIEDVSSSEYGRLGMDPKTLYFVFQNVRFPCKHGKYRVLFDVVVNEYRDDQDNRFPPLHLWPMGTYPGDCEEMINGSYKAGVLEFGHKVHVTCSIYWTRLCAVDYLNPVQYEVVEMIVKTRQLYTEKLWHVERERLAARQKERQAQRPIQVPAHAQCETQAPTQANSQAFAQVRPSRTEVQIQAAYAEAPRQPRIQPYHIQAHIPAQIQAHTQTEAQPHAQQGHIQVPQAQNRSEISAHTQRKTPARTQGKIYLHNYPQSLNHHVQPVVKEVQAHAQGKTYADIYSPSRQPPVEEYDPAQGWAGRERYSSGVQSSPSDTEAQDSCHEE
ncbi:hypothetical protein QBC32DRAFT_387417 [Pseudoneurospora amorphoporcata]|uniref:Uncharacterized protein n=1 Tax=Pseudoneurospora amorphoporcata TaxID=241081 RepID=A0AAN6SAU6_9PEZI|nr:hypothetical protein QBC32DRAFT_387417 [Pseudoneurospora amorphoporcata]